LHSYIPHFENAAEEKLHVRFVQEVPHDVCFEVILCYRLVIQVAIGISFAHKFLPLLER
uniref:Phosphoribulokinase n=1 Tax=Brugia timori TaxID=42155 RepID=A0A0R3RA70_9BILA